MEEWKGDNKVKRLEVEEGVQAEDVTGGDLASKATPLSLGGGRGAFVSCTPDKIYRSRCENSHQFLRLGWKESASPVCGCRTPSSQPSVLSPLCPLPKKKGKKEKKKQVGGN